MQALQSVQDVFYVDVLTLLQLQTVKPPRDVKVLRPKNDSYIFFLKTFKDGRPEPHWAVSMEDRNFGTPIERLRSATRSKAVQVTDERGKEYKL